jgi:hypothetical protein
MVEESDVKKLYATFLFQYHHTISAPPRTASTVMLAVLPLVRRNLAS